MATVRTSYAGSPHRLPARPRPPSKVSLARRRSLPAGEWMLGTVFGRQDAQVQPRCPFLPRSIPPGCVCSAVQRRRHGAGCWCRGPRASDGERVEFCATRNMLRETPTLREAEAEAEAEQQAPSAAQAHEWGMKGQDRHRTAVTQACAHALPLGARGCPGKRRALWWRAPGAWIA